ncbi:hypothetical protein MPSEU_000353400 [Mayamaea pseudoterrestris]|nr:hypothetical protein MPSEU_000353400 [Mayamaea pseudoterrestris]
MSSTCTTSSEASKRTFISLLSPSRSSKRTKSSVHGFHTTAANCKRRTNDCLHKTIHLDPVTCVLMDTPLMQRLRGLNQLGTAFLVYNDCTHDRFGHSLGVAHLAEKLCMRFQDVQPQLQCSAKDVLCAKLAGLLHDVGHGAYSHVFEEFVKQLPAHLNKHPELMERYSNENWPTVPDDYSHEETSLQMIDAILESIGLQIDLTRLDEPLRQIGDGTDALSIMARDGSVLTSRDFCFIKEAINGGPVAEIWQAVQKYEGFVGRPAEKEWLYDIVCNRHSGLDVDKMDYFSRDERGALGVDGSIDERMIAEAYVAWGSCPQPDKCFKCCRGGDGRHLMICYPEKMTQNAMNFFNKRKTMHEIVYQHKTVCAAQSLVCDIFCHADPFFRIYIAPEDRTGKAKTGYDELPLSRAMLDPQAFVSLKDSVIDQIYNCRDPNLAKARQLIKRWRARAFYKCIGVKNIDRELPSDLQLWKKLTEGEIVRQMVAFHGKHDGVQQLTEEDLVVQKCSVHCGRKDKDPVMLMRFIEKGKMNMLQNSIDDLPEAILPPKCSYTRPEYFIANEIRVFCRDSDKTELANHVFGLWLSHIADEIETTPFDEQHAPVMLTQESDDDMDDDDDYNRAPAGLRTPPYAFIAQSAHRTSITPSQLYGD